MITEKQRTKRRNGIGSSDTPAILGVLPWRGPLDVYMDKVEGIEQAETPAMRLGSRMETVIIDEAMERIGGSCRRNVYRRNQREECMFAHLDALAETPGGTVIIEAKYSSVSDGWGAEDQGSEGVPAYVLAQVMHQLDCVPEAQFAYVALLSIRFGPPKVSLYRIDRDDALCDLIRKACHAFWHEHVLQRRAPEGLLRDRRTIERLSRLAGDPTAESVQVDPDLWKRAYTLRNLRKAVDAALDRVQGTILAQMGQAESGVCCWGSVTRKRIARAGYTVPPSEYVRVTYKPDELTVDELGELGGDLTMKDAEELLVTGLNASIGSMLTGVVNGSAT